MKDIILKSLYYQTLFLNEKDRNEKIMRNLPNPNDVIIFIDAILYTLQNTNFFQINNSRMESLIEILKKIQSHPMWPISHFQQLDNKAIENIINLCKEQIAQNKENSYKNVLAGINKDICYSMQEMQKRTLLYSSFACTSPEKVAQYILTDYPIINSLVTRLEVTKRKKSCKRYIKCIEFINYNL